MDLTVIRRLDRRVTLQWLAAASLSLAIPSARLGAAKAASLKSVGYGMNPDLTKTYTPGELWPLTLTPAQRITVAALCDTIVPADAESPSASAVGVVDFIDEWISAPYVNAGHSHQSDSSAVGSNFAEDRALILEGLAWLNAESAERFGRAFAELTEAQQGALCDDICYLPKAQPKFEQPALFFARFRDLTAGGFYTAPEGMKDLRYVGNVAQTQFAGPPPEVLKKVGLG